MSEARAGYPSDVSDDEWAFAAPYLTLLREDAHQRKHDLRAVFDAVRWVVKTGAHWRYLPNDFPPWAAVYYCVQPVECSRSGHEWETRQAGLADEPAEQVRPPARLGQLIDYVVP